MSHTRSSGEKRPNLLDTGITRIRIKICPENSSGRCLNVRTPPAPFHRRVVRPFYFVVFLGSSFVLFVAPMGYNYMYYIIVL